MREWTAAACAASGPARLYDRWPWIHLAIAGVLGAVALVTLEWVREHPRWLWFLFLAVPALVLHQFEEYVLPGGYAPWFNAHVYRSRNPHFPLHKQQVALNHLPLMVLFPLLALAGSRWPFFGLGGLYGLMADAMFHVAATAAGGRYAPGTVTGLVLYLPLGLGATPYFVRVGDVTVTGLLVAAFGGVLVLSALLFLPTGWLARRHPALLADPLAPPSSAPPATSPR